MFHRNLLVYWSVYNHLKKYKEILNPYLASRSADLRYPSLDPKPKQ